jgi:hypothetical protein
MVWKVAAAVTVITAVLTVALGASFYISADGRRCRRPVLNRYARRTNQFREIDEDESYDNGWFVRELRCSKATFESVVLRVSSRWNEVNTPIHARAVFTIRERVGLTLFHLASLETYARSGQVFGISKSRAILCVDQVLKVLINC